MTDAKNLNAGEGDPIQQKKVSFRDPPLARVPVNDRAGSGKLTEEAASSNGRPPYLVGKIGIAFGIKHVDPRKIFLVTTRRDKSVPTFLQERLRDALGAPEAISLPTGHYSSVAYLPLILERGRWFLARRFVAVDP